MGKTNNSIEVARLYRVEGESRLKAFVDVALAGFVVKGIRVVQGEKGLFVGMPRQQGKDGRWFNSVYPLSKEHQEQLNEIVLAAYNG